MIVSDPLIPNPDQPDLIGSTSRRFIHKTVIESIDRNLQGNSRSKNRSDTLAVIDAPTEDTLFNLGASISGMAAPTTRKNLGASYYDPIDYGVPNSDGFYWRQQLGNSSCAVVAQISVYESLTGDRISEVSACNYVQSQGWFDPQSGTPSKYIGNLLNVMNIPTYGGENANISQLAMALSKGDKPIVGLDGNEIWSPRRDRYGNPVELKDAGHAVWVTGIDVKPNGGINIILNDSGRSYGKAEVVNYKDFYNAWQDFSFQMVVADNPFT